jgi:hypothetical protein
MKRFNSFIISPLFICCPAQSTCVWICLQVIDLFAEGSFEVCEKLLVKFVVSHFSSQHPAGCCLRISIEEKLVELLKHFVVRK